MEKKACTMSVRFYETDPPAELVTVLDIYNQTKAVIYSLNMSDLKAGGILLCFFDLPYVEFKKWI